MDRVCDWIVHRSRMPAPQIPQTIQETKNYRPVTRQDGRLISNKKNGISVRDDARESSHRYAYAQAPAL